MLSVNSLIVKSFISVAAGRYFSFTCAFSATVFGNWPSFIVAALQDAKITQLASIKLSTVVNTKLLLMVFFIITS